MPRKLQKIANVIFIRRSIVSLYVSAILGDWGCVTVTLRNDGNLDGAYRHLEAVTVACYVIGTSDNWKKRKRKTGKKICRRNQPSLPRKADNTQILPACNHETNLHRKQVVARASVHGERWYFKTGQLRRGQCVRDYIAKWSHFGWKQRANKPTSKKGSARSHDKCKKVDRCAKPTRWRGRVGRALSRSTRYHRERDFQPAFCFVSFCSVSRANERKVRKEQEGKIVASTTRILGVSSNTFRR